MAKDRAALAGAPGWNATARPAGFELTALAMVKPKFVRTPRAWLSDRLTLAPAATRSSRPVFGVPRPRSADLALGDHRADAVEAGGGVAVEDPGGALHRGPVGDRRP